MSRPMTIELHGFKELERELLKFPTTLARRSLGRAVASGAAVVRKAARIAAAAQGLRLTGLLARSIKIKSVRSGNRGTRRYKVYHSDSEYIKAGKVGKDGKAQNYGRLYEGGFKDMSRHKPHLRPALDENTGAVIKAIRDRLSKEIRVMRFETATGMKYKKAFESQLGNY